MNKKTVRKISDQFFKWATFIWNRTVWQFESD